MHAQPGAYFAARARRSSPARFSSSWPSSPACDSRISAATTPAECFEQVFGDASLHLAASAGHIEIARCLLKHGADPSAKDNVRDRPPARPCEALRACAKNCRAAWLTRERRSAVTVRQDTRKQSQAARNADPALARPRYAPAPPLAS